MQSSNTIENINASAMENKLFNQQLKSELQSNKSSINSNNNRKNTQNYLQYGDANQKTKWRPDKRQMQTRGGIFTGSNKRNDLMEKLNDNFDAPNDINYSKKKNLNHLLNFSYESRERFYDHDNDYRMKQFWTTKLNKNSVFSKEQFLQANCQFVVSDVGDYSVHFTNPDVLVMWENILEIQINSCEPLSCPICLYEPVAAKMTKCGHVYCWPCILHYLALSDKAWRKCPICFECVYKTDLKSVKTSTLNQFKIGDNIKLNLMFKEKSSTIILPISLIDEFNKTKPRELNDFNKKEYSSSLNFMKMHTASKDYIRNEIIKREQNELHVQIKCEGDQPEACFITEALNLIDERLTELNKNNTRTKSIEIKTDEVKKVVTESILVNTESKNFVSYIDAFDEQTVTQLSEVSSDDKQEEEAEEDLEEVMKPNSSIDDDNSSVAEEINLSKVNKELAREQSENEQFYYYFYQSDDGQRIYINSLNLKCLIHEYSTISNCPEKIEAQIIAIENVSMSEELRKRFKYLSHLPLHSEVQIVELDLKEPLLSKTTLQLFEKEIQHKRLFRIKKEKQELRQLKKQQLSNEEDHFYTNYSTFDDKNKITSNSQIHASENIVDYKQEFPQIDDENLNSIEKPISPSLLSSSPIAIESQQGAAFSFAQMLKHENIVKSDAPENLWPKLNVNIANNNTNSQTMNAWSLLASKKVQKTPNKTELSIEDEEFETESMPAPGYRQSFFSAIDSALTKITKEKGQKNQAIPEGNLDNKSGNQNKKKKNKSKQLLLFST